MHQGSINAEAHETRAATWKEGAYGISWLEQKAKGVFIPAAPSKYLVRAKSAASRRLSRSHGKKPVPLPEHADSNLPPESQRATTFNIKTFAPRPLSFEKVHEDWSDEGEREDEAEDVGNRGRPRTTLDQVNILLEQMKQTKQDAAAKAAEDDQEKEEKRKRKQEEREQKEARKKKKDQNRATDKKAKPAEKPADARWDPLLAINGRRPRAAGKRKPAPR